jgi:hypothetical protein
MSTTSGPPERNYYNAYDPSSAAALAFTILFAVSAGVYIVQAIRGKAYWMWPLLVGVLGEVAGESVLQSHFQVLLELELILYLTLGYAARYVSAKNQTSREAWLAQLLLIILAPNVRMDTRSSFIFSHRGGHRCSLVLNSFFWRSTVSRRSRLHPLRQTHVLRRSWAVDASSEMGGMDLHLWVAVVRSPFAFSGPRLNALPSFSFLV